MHVDAIIGDTNVLNLIPGALLPALAISAMQFFIYEAADGFVGSMLIQFAIALGTGYISGCLYPSYFFPRVIQKMASVLPAWAARVHMNEWVSTGPSARTSVTLVLYFVLFMILSVVARWIRLNKREGGL